MGTLSFSVPVVGAFVRAGGGLIPVAGLWKPDGLERKVLSLDPNSRKYESGLNDIYLPQFLREGFDSTTA